MPSESMEEMVQPTAPISKPTACVKIPKSQAQKLQIGQNVSYTTTGKITGIREGYGPKNPNKEDKYSVDVEVDEVKMSANTADVEYKKLTESE